MKPSVVHAFLSDALRICAQARECVSQLAEQADKKSVSPAQVRTFFQQIHTLKGTASLIDQGTPIVTSLHAIESLLACQNVSESARRYEWIEPARIALDDVLAYLQTLQRRERKPKVKAEPLVKGFLARAPGKTGGLIWFPLGCVVRIVSPEEMASAQALCIEDAWVPVVRPPINLADRAFFGLAVRSSDGYAVLAVVEVIGIYSWGDASRQGARSGLDYLLGASSSRPARVAHKTKKSA